jgi:hypothetical protein
LKKFGSNAKGRPQGTLGLAKGPQDIFKIQKVPQPTPKLSENYRKPFLSSNTLLNICFCKPCCYG